MRGNLADESIVDLWLDLMMQGRALAAVGGPPCETWSIARQGPPGPRPLRSKDALWGILGLTPSERQQVDLGNALLRTMILFLYVAAAKGLAALMEHPAEPTWAPEAPSSWQLPEMRHAVARLGARAHYVDQCMTGAAYKKPSQLLSVGLDTLGDHIEGMAQGGVCNGLHDHVTLTGREEDGAYRTAAAKEYPPGLCKIMATAVLDAARRHLALVPAGAVEHEEEYARFYVPLDPYAEFVMQHDCAAGATGGQLMD